MRIKLDENIAASAADRLMALGHDVHTVLEEELSGHIDSEVWAAAQLEERCLITQDLDFSDRRRFAAGTHAGVLLVRLPDAEQWRITDYLVAWLSAPGSGLDPNGTGTTSSGTTGDNGSGLEPDGRH
jgi:predicted nuclease of predicted toxin-antitoxin system